MYPDTFCYFHHRHSFVCSMLTLVHCRWRCGSMEEFSYLLLLTCPLCLIKAIICPVCLIKELIPYALAVWVSLGQINRDQLLHHPLNGDALSKECCMLLSDVFVGGHLHSWLPLGMQNLQCLLTLGMQNAFPALISSWWEETLSCPIDFWAQWGM